MPEAISGRILFRAVSKLVLLLSSFVKFRFLLRLSTNFTPLEYQKSTLTP